MLRKFPFENCDSFYKSTFKPGKHVSENRKKSSEFLFFLIFFTYFMHPKFNINFFEQNLIWEKISVYFLMDQRLFNFQFFLF